MRILCVIDHLGSGGAQRQVVGLACALQGRGHQVELFQFYPEYDFFRGRIDVAGIVVHEAPKRRLGNLGVVRELARVLRTTQPESVIAFLGTPGVYAIAAAFLSRSPARLYVSERSSHLAEQGSLRDRLRGTVQRVLYLACDGVVSNSRTQADWLTRHRWLRSRVRWIPNGLAPEAFKPSPLSPPAERLRLLAIGRVGPEKNPLGLMQALQWLRARGEMIPIVSWVGADDDSAEGQRLRAQLEAVLASDPVLAASWHWLGRRRDIQDLLAAHDALIHPAFYEGFPNAVCEAFAAMRPVLLSAVCDHPAIAGGGERGVLFDPASPESIGTAILHFGALTPAQREVMVARAFEFARSELSEHRLGERYELLLEARGGGA